MLERETFDVLVSDIGMPGRDGYELIRTVRQGEAPGQRMPAVALTAYARHEDRNVALAEGFDEHVAKPVDAGALIGTIARLVRASERRAGTGGLVDDPVDGQSGRWR